MPVKILPATGAGSVTVQAENAISSDFTLTMPGRTGNIITSADSGTVTGTMLAAGTVAQSNFASNVAGNGPAFGAFQSVAQAALGAAVYTKLVFQTEEFDLGGCFNNTASTATLNGLSVPAYAFMPNIAGYYQINGAAQITGTTGAVVAAIYRNGALFKLGTYIAVSSSGPLSVVSSLISLNGSTDYIELFCFTATSLAPAAGQSSTYFNGFLARAT